MVAEAAVAAVAENMKDGEEAEEAERQHETQEYMAETCFLALFSVLRILLIFFFVVLL